MEVQEAAGLKWRREFGGPQSPPPPPVPRREGYVVETAAEAQRRIRASTGGHHGWMPPAALPPLLPQGQAHPLPRGHIFSGVMAAEELRMARMEGMRAGPGGHAGESAMNEQPPPPAQASPYTTAPRRPLRRPMLRRMRTWRCASQRRTQLTRRMTRAALRDRRRRRRRDRLGWVPAMFPLGFDEGGLLAVGVAMTGLS